MTSTNRNPKIGEIYLMRFSGIGSEQSGVRPGLVLQNNMGNRFSPNVIALPLTRSLKKVSQPTHVFISCRDNGLKANSMVLCENPERMSKERIGTFITRLSHRDMARVAEAYLLATGAISFLDPQSLPDIWEKAHSMNIA